ncbi:hypothetical protein DFH29DRAFT_877813 [Suillus ampliporus]|nr:hypothetical protein DFH29DRAFT_877813 [Suillus ampliporus]
MTKECSLSREELVEALLQDVFDSIAMQDHLDGGITVLIRCPGFKADATPSLEEVVVNLYVTLWELQESYAQIGGDVTVLVQAFCEEFVIPHMEHFMKHCRIEGIKPPHRFTSTRINLTGPPHLPPPSVATGACIKCSGYPKESFERDLSFGSKTPSLLPASVAICHATASASVSSSHATNPHSQILRRCPADAFLANRNPQLSQNAVPIISGQDDDKENYGHGKEVLGGIMKVSKDEYYSLTKEEKANLIEEYMEYKDMKATGQHISTKSKINDVTHTLKAVKNEVQFPLGTTDLLLCGITFATEGMQDFMESTMGIDNQDLVSKMEDFAIQGMKEIAARDPGTKMQWAQYWHNIVKRYSVVIKGWPEKIPFVNLSTVSSSLTELEMLLRKWQSGAIYWKCLTPEELEDMEKERDNNIENGVVVEKRQCVHLDKGKKRYRDADDNISQCQKKTKVYKSAETVGSDSEEEDLESSVPAPLTICQGHHRHSIPSSDETLPMSLPISSTNATSTSPLILDGTNMAPLSASSLGPAPLVLPDSHADSSMFLPPDFDDFVVNFDPSFILMPYTDRLDNGESFPMFF